jgi:hypothetical protein
MPDHEPLYAAAPNPTVGEPALGGCADQPVPVLQRRTAVATWPLLILALPAAIAVWSGWVGIGEMTGFGEIRPLPGIWDTFHLDTAVTLPVGVEAYAAFALHAWLTSNQAVSVRTRRFARWSAIAAMILGMSGQVSYHLLNQAGMTRAPWEVTTLVACLPVLVLGMGSALAHLLRGDSADRAVRHRAQQVTDVRACGHATSHAVGDQGCPNVLPASVSDARPPARIRIADLQAAAATVVAAGLPVTRRSLRAAGLHGSNADLGMLARRARIQLPRSGPADS